LNWKVFFKILIFVNVNESVIVSSTSKSLKTKTGGSEANGEELVFFCFCHFWQKTNQMKFKITLFNLYKYDYLIWTMKKHNLWKKKKYIRTWRIIFKAKQVKNIISHQLSFLQKLKFNISCCNFWKMFSE
jgi:hypothetical protein